MTFLDLFSVYLGDKHTLTSALMFVDPVLGCVSPGKMLGCAFPRSNRDRVTNPFVGTACQLLRAPGQLCTRS